VIDAYTVLRRLLSARLALLHVMRGLHRRQRWQYDRLAEFAVRLKALDGQTPEIPDYPDLHVPDELKSQFKDGV